MTREGGIAVQAVGQLFQLAPDTRTFDPPPDMAEGGHAVYDTDTGLLYYQRVPPEPGGDTKAITRLRDERPLHQRQRGAMFLVQVVTVKATAVAIPLVLGKLG